MNKKRLFGILPRLYTRRVFTDALDYNVSTIKAYKWIF